MSEQRNVAIGAPPSKPVGYDDYGRAQTARNGSQLQGYRRDDDYDVQSVHYQYTDTFDTFDLEVRRAMTETDPTQIAYRLTELQDAEYVALADYAVQRYLDLFNDKSGKLTSTMKAELRAQALKGFEQAIGKGQLEQSDVQNSMARMSFETLVQVYLNKGTTRDVMAPGARRTLEKGNTNLEWGDTLRRRDAVREMVSKIATVEARLQPPTPGKKEADALMNSIWGGTLSNGASDRFDTREMLLFVG